MNDTLVHRGPDDDGQWLDPQAGIALGHRRLAILDLSQAGHQPMISASGRYVLVFNGEIYNHHEIRTRLDPVASPVWRGHSDTETLLAAINAWGIRNALQACAGMLSFALWDRQERVLSLARDRMGEKPLYYGWQADTLLFGSELKALRAHAGFRAEVNYDVLPLYLRHGYIPAPWSVWRGIRKLLPGTFVQFESEVTKIGDLPEPRRYWAMIDAIESGQSSPFAGSDEEAIDALDFHLKQAVAGQLVADVPVGTFLSGGIDSSVVVAAAQAQSRGRVKTFTIGFTEHRYNEAEHAKKVAAHLGTDHTEFYVTSKEAQQVIPSLPTMYDEPFGDSSAIPTYLVSKLAKQRVSVALSGDGGDELFAGYRRYFSHKSEAIWQRNRLVPPGLREAFAFILRYPVASGAELLTNLLPSAIRRRLGGRLVARAKLESALLACQTHEDFYRIIVSVWPDNTAFDSLRPPLPYGMRPEELAMVREPVAKMMAMDTTTYLPDDILVKVDRAAMAVSLETRVPLLDHRMAEFAWRLPHTMKVRDGQGKWLLKQLLYRYIPQSLVDRPKMGFGIPVDEWLRGPLREWADPLLSINALEEKGFHSASAIRARWQEHSRGDCNWRDSLWPVLMWQATLTK